MGYQREEQTVEGTLRVGGGTGGREGGREARTVSSGRDKYNFQHYNIIQ